MYKLIAQHTGASPEAIENLLQNSGAGVFRSQVYENLVNKIDVDKLSTSMVKTRRYLDDALPPLTEHYMKKHKLQEFPLSGYMICNWVVAYLRSPDNSSDLLDKHRTVSRTVMIDVLPDVLDLLGKAPEHQAMWQRSFATMVLPMLAK